MAGKPVPLSPSQRAEVLAYRHRVVDIARQGMEVGKQGAALGIEVARTAIAGVLSGASDEQIQQRAKAKTAGIRHTAKKICDRLPALMNSQHRLAADLPAFRPYADLTPAKIAKSRSDVAQSDD